MANQGFFSHIGGSAQRLLNGNILVCSAAEGHVFEATSSGAVVWEYVNPVSTNGIVAYKRDNWPLYNAVYRAMRYPATHPALSGRTLTGFATIVGGAPSYISAPVIGGVACSPTTPVATDTVWVSAAVTNSRIVASTRLIYIAGGTTNAVTMLDDGAHHDGATGDGLYGAQIPAFAAGTVVRYYISAQDDFDNTATYPTGAPTNTLSYTVYLSVVASGASLTQVASGLHFTEGPAADAAGNIYFSDVSADVIYEWSLSGQLTTFRTNSGGANGLCFDRGGNLLACEGDNGRLVSISMQTNITVLTGTFGVNRYNEPNDLWIAPTGGVYFTDPVFFTNVAPQGGQHVYYLAPDSSTVTRVITDMVKPNGLVGTPDGKILYIADWGATNVYRYTVNTANGTLANKTAFANVKCDGMTLDSEGHIYLTETAVLVYNTNGVQLEQIAVPERPTNLEFGGSDRKTLFITTDSGSLYSIRTRVQGVSQGGQSNQSPVIVSVTNAAAYGGSTVWVTALVTGGVAGASVTLNYNVGGGVAATNTVFLETMATNSPKPWFGAGCNNPWIVTCNGGNPFEQRIGANYGAGNPNGMEFKGGTANLADNMITASNKVDARGISGTMTFAVWTDGLTPNTGWAMQLDSGTGFSTRLSELTGSNHGWQVYTNNLLASDLVSNLVVRFQFRGGVSSNRVDLDQISIKVAAAGGNWTGAVMYDDGLHGDALAGDGVYGAQVPAQVSGTVVSYYVTVVAPGGTVTNPVTAPGVAFSYTVNAPTNAWSMQYLPDTGQTTNYTGTFGEDSDYAIHPPAYINNGNGTISDKVTGLMWQQTDGGEMAWESATNYPSTLTLGGYSDWRLPTCHELYSISKQGAINPALDTNYFAVTVPAAEYWWSRDVQANNAANIWVANAGGGIGNHPKTETIGAGGTRRFHVRCVRGASPPSSASPIHHFTNNGNGTITDTDTGLMWQQAQTPSATNWEGALRYAETNTLAGYADWRLPNVKELQSINDETLVIPSLDTVYFTGATASRFWSSTTMHGVSNEAWFIDAQYGVTSYSDKGSNYLVRCVRGGTTNIVSTFNAQFVRIPGGSYTMGDHFGFVDPDHPTDELPLHTVYISPLYMETTLLTCREYCDYLNSALYQGLIEVRTNLIYAVGGTNVYSDTYAAYPYSPIQLSNTTFIVRNNRGRHPITGVRWFGAIAYCNWLSQRYGFKSCYRLDTGDVDFTRNGFRLPTEAEWEYAARGGETNTYRMFPWGDDTNIDGTRANWDGSGDPWEAAEYPRTTPVGFYNGAMRYKADYNWPGAQSTYQTSDGANGFGLYDMSGNVWEWVNDWYASDYYANCFTGNIVTNPLGPTTGSPMPDGKPYRALRGGNWYNGGGQTYYGHGRVANRDPSYFRGPDPVTGQNDPDGSWFHVGFRVMRPEKIEQTVGLFINATNACPGYTLMAPMHHTNTYLINNDGQYVHMWSSAYEPGRAAYLMENGHMFRACMITSGGPSTGGGEGGRIEEYDWNGNMVWAFDYYSSTYIAHHDFKVLPNGNVIVLVAEKKTYAEVIAAGFNPSLLDPTIVSQGYMLPDCLIEVQPTRPYGGTIVWEWHIWDHMIQDYSATKENYGVVADHPELINVNGTGIKIPQFWNHVNGIDYNAQLDQVMLSVRGNNELFVIDHNTSTAQAATHAGGRYNKGGDILYRWGDPEQYDRGTSGNRQLYQQHHTHWIPTNCPGAGNILIYNNGIGRGYSTVNEIVPPVDAAGNYSISAGAAFGPSSPTWTYVANPPTNFYSSEISGAQRQPNGNTLICEGIKGKLFEVTPAGQIVWQYICPVTTAVLAQGTVPPTDEARTDQFMNAVFRVYRYPTNYPGLAGKDLSARGTIETYAGTSTDTVGLGLPDTWVRAHFGNLSAVTSTSDHDADGVFDIAEYRLGIDPTRWSSAFNGVPDGWALAHGFDPTLAATAALTNQNGYTTLQSYIADLDPTNSSSVLAVTGVATIGNNTYITWVGGTNSWQYLECSTNLASVQWSTIFTNTPPTPLTNSVIHIGAPATNLFYRIRATR
jgi:sugar lactone lactonase YvrE/formylglycine-generating enzyme required for sulfatase activity